MARDSGAGRDGHRERGEAAEPARSRALDEITADAAHDLNNLLMVILGHADLLLARLDGAEREGLEGVRRAAQLARDIVGRLQGATASAPLEEQAAWVDPCRAIEEMIVLALPHWEYQAMARGVTYEIARDFTATPQIFARPSALREALLNLFVNALEAMPGGGRVGFRVRADAEAVVISVSDTGPGIPEPVRMRIFDPFFTTKPAPADGLGLSVCSSIVAELGGSLDVESEVGSGSTFTLRLPHARLARSASRLRRGGDRRWAKGADVLVIENDRGVADSLARLLREAGHGVEVVTNGPAGIERYRTGRFACVLADLRMPDLSGLTISRAIKDHDPDAHVTLLTGSGEQVDEHDSAAAGVDRIIVKPVSRAQIVQILDDEASCARS